MKQIIMIIFILNVSLIVFADGIESKITELDSGKPASGSNVYILEMKNIGAASDGYDYRWQNIWKARTMGFEFAMAGQPRRWIDYSADFVYTDAKYDEKRDLSLEYSDFIPRSPALTGNLQLSIKPKKLILTVSANYVGSMYTDHVPYEDEELYELFETDPFVLVNTRASYKLLDKLDIYINIENLTDYSQPERDITDVLSTLLCIV